VKIGVVIERLEAWRGGAETSTLELCRLLVERGHEVHVITTTNCQSLPNIIFHTLKHSALIPSRRVANFARRAALFIPSQSFDVVLAISLLPEADVYQPRGGLLAETLARNVYTHKSASRRLLKRALMAINVKQRSMLDLERRVFRPDGPLIACVSNYVARQCEEYYDATPPRTRVIFNGVHPRVPEAEEWNGMRVHLRKELELQDDDLLLLFLAHNFRLKGLYPLLETASRLVVGGFTGFHLLVVGRDNVVPFQKHIESLGLQRFVTFMGPTQRATAFYAACDVCVHPTYYDPCSRVVLESLYHGIPVITTSFNGAAEAMQDGREGFVIQSPEDIGMWARRITDLSSAELRRKMSENAVKLREQISMKRHVAELDSLFHEIVERKQSATRA